MVAVFKKISFNTLSSEMRSFKIPDIPKGGNPKIINFLIFE